MDFIDLVLNCAGLLLWLNWRAEGLDAAYRAPVISIAHVVRKASSSSLKRWKAMVSLGTLLVGRAIFYWYFSERLPYTFKLNLIAVELPFSSNRFWLTLLYSVLSFFLLVAFFYLALLLFSLLNSHEGEKTAAHRFVRVHLGRVDILPLVVRALLPGLLGMAGWMACAHALAGLKIIPAPGSMAELWQRGLVIGLGVYVHWRWVILAVLLLYLTSTYIYFGRHPIWEYLQTTGRNLLAPLRPVPLRIGHLDAAPLVGIAVVSAITVLLESGWKFPAHWTWMPAMITHGVLPWLYQHAPF